MHFAKFLLRHSPSYLCLFLYDHKSSLALCCIHSNMSLSLLYWGDEIWTQHHRQISPGLSRGERSSPPTCWQHSCWCNKGCCLCWGGYCWLTFSCLSTRTLRTFFAKQLSGPSVLACNGAWGCSFSCAGYSLSRTLHFSLLNLTTFLSAHLSCLLMSFWMVAKLPGALTTPPSFVSGHL